MFGNASFGPVSCREQAAVLALVERTESEWYRVSQLLDEAGSSLRLVENALKDIESPELLAAADDFGVQPGDIDRFENMIEELDARGISLVTVLDPDYPTNLREIHNRPPFFFVNGTLSEDDDRAIAVVGTRKASPDGLCVAAKLATELVGAEVTVLSGLAAGIDAAAHSATIDAGGRTVAVMGTGINTIYPKANRDLAQRIVETGGALVSQFWPDAPPTKYTFPMRNVVTSGMALGTVVIEANSRSGARNQATHALKHGKRLFLWDTLVTQEEWAQQYALRPGARVVRSVDEVLEAIEPVLRTAEQLTLG